MGVGQVWSRALVYFGIVEEDEYWDEEAYAAEEELERTYDRSESANVRRLSPRRQRREEFEDWSEPDAAERGGLGPGARAPHRPRLLQPELIRRQHWLCHDFGRAGR
jgi:hypothetical protein